MHLQTARALYRVVVHLALFFGVKSSATSAQREVNSAVIVGGFYVERWKFSYLREVLRSQR